MSVVPGGTTHRIALIGGGRWARVIVETLHRTGERIHLSVHSAGNAAGMAAWIMEHGYSNSVEVHATPPQINGDGRPEAAIVANAAAGHFDAAARVIRAGIPVLVEKPIAGSAAEAEALLHMADGTGTLLAASHVFLFAGSIERFAASVDDHSGIANLCLTWTDPAGEHRYGEAKRYDPAVPLLRDVLPHALPLLQRFSPRPLQLQSLELHEGGSRVSLALSPDCRITLARDADARRRLLELQTPDGPAALDFSMEPGTVRVGAGILDASPVWNQRPSPMVAMLQAFLAGVRSGALDERLSAEKAIRSLRIADAAWPGYLRAQADWLCTRAGSPLKTDIRYALTERIAMAQGAIPVTDRQVGELWNAIGAMPAFAGASADMEINRLAAGIAGSARG